MLICRERRPRGTFRQAVTQLPPRLGKLLVRIVDAGVEFVLVGGLAVITWGHIRATRDMSLVPSPAPDNLDLLAATLVEIDGRIEIQGRLTGPDSVSTFLRAGDKTYVVTELGAVDVLQGLPQVPRYEELRSDAVDVNLDGRIVSVCSLAHLRAMKKAAGRPLDIEDLQALADAHPERADD